MATSTITHEQRSRIQEILATLDLAPVDRDLENRRKNKRVNLRAGLTAYLLSLRGTPSLTLHTRNLSTSGMGFVSRRPFQPGEQIAVELYMVPSMAKLVLAKTTFSRYLRDGLYEVGCTFLEAVARDESEIRFSRDRIPARWLELALPKHTPMKPREASPEDPPTDYP